MAITNTLKVRANVLTNFCGRNFPSKCRRVRPSNIANHIWTDIWKTGTKKYPAKLMAGYFMRKVRGSVGCFQHAIDSSSQLVTHVPLTAFQQNEHPLLVGSILSHWTVGFVLIVRVPYRRPFRENILTDIPVYISDCSATSFPGNLPGNLLSKKVVPGESNPVLHVRESLNILRMAP